MNWLSNDEVTLT